MFQSNNGVERQGLPKVGQNEYRMISVFQDSPEPWSMRRTVVFSVLASAFLWLSIVYAAQNFLHH